MKFSGSNIIVNILARRLFEIFLKYIQKYINSAIISKFLSNVMLKHIIKYKFERKLMFLVSKFNI